MESFQAYTAKIKEYENKYGELVKKDRYCPAFHLYPPVGWMNDPNGLCQLHGIYHVFFQYSPFDVNGGEKFWGHYQSRDLLSWEYTGMFLAPDTRFDKDGVYSGSAFCDDRQMFLYYTGNVKQSGDYDYTYTGREANTILVTSEDGIVAGKKEVLLTNADYPSDMSCHVRDPKVWREGDTWYMVQGARTRQDKGCVLVFTSEDERSFQFHNVISKTEDMGYMWECPDLFTLSDRRVLSFSPQGLDAKEHKYQNTYQSGYCMVYGDFLGADAEANALSEFTEWDMGFDFYAPQTFLDERGRRILIGWLGMIDCDYENQTKEWQHVLTLPRELTLSRDKKRILQNPVKELTALRNGSENFLERYTKKTEECFEIILENLCDGLCAISINDDLCIGYDPQTNVIKLQFKGSMGAHRTVRTAVLKRGLESIRMFVDTSVIELYMNHGECVMSSRFYKEDAAVCLSVATENGNGTYYSLRGYQIGNQT